MLPDQSPEKHDSNLSQNGAIPADHPLSKLLGRELKDLLYLIYLFGFNEVRAIKPSLEDEKATSKLQVTVDASQVHFPVETIEICFSDHSLVADSTHLSISITLKSSQLIKPEEHASLVSALKAFSPQCREGEVVQINQTLPLANLVPVCELIFASFHNSSGLSQNMAVEQMARVVLDLPDLNRRTVKLFDSRLVNGLGEFPKNSNLQGASEALLIEQIRESRDLIRAHGRSVLFQLSDDSDLEDFLSLSSGMISSYLTVNLPDELTLLTLLDMAEEFLDSGDLLGLIGAVCIVAESCQSSICQHSLGLKDDEARIPTDFYSIGERALGVLERFHGDSWKKLQTRKLEAAIYKALVASAFGALVAPSTGPIPDASVAPHRYNRRLIWQELNSIDSQYPSCITDTGKALLEQHRGDEALLIMLAYSDPDLMEQVALVVESRDISETALVISDRILNLVVRELSREDLGDLSSIIDYLASKFARSHNIAGYNYEFSIS